MSTASKRDYLHSIKDRYQNSYKTEKKKSLTNFVPRVLGATIVKMPFDFLIKNLPPRVFGKSVNMV
jgi:hypothetical protein